MRFCIEERIKTLRGISAAGIDGYLFRVVQIQAKIVQAEILEENKKEANDTTSLLHFLPDPCSAMWIVIPFVLMKRCVISSIIGGHFECLRNTERERERERSIYSLSRRKLLAALGSEKAL
jgi:hypothetical protein